MGQHRKYPPGSDAWRSRTYRGGKRRAGRPPFAGVDGEGGNIWGPHRVGERPAGHYYYLLRIGDRELFNEDGSPLDTEQCLGFIADAPKDKTYVAFFFTYDVTKILADLTIERAKSLYNPKPFTNKDGKMGFPWIDWRQFQLTVRDGKMFGVRRRGTKQWTIINDVGSFFQSSFVKALETWLGRHDSETDEYIIDDPKTRWIVDAIAAGKNDRNDFGELTQSTRDYCRLECEQLAKLMETFRDHCDALGLRPSAWQGPGYLVTAAMKLNNFPRNESYAENVPKRVWDMAQAAYYGGRFEPPIIGRIDRPVHQYDINSAYAASYRRLPCLQHGRWHRIDKHASKYPEWTIMHVKFRHEHTHNIMGLPVRNKKGQISFPERGQGYYWLNELNSESRRCHIDVIEAYGFFGNCACTPFAWIDELYNKRMEVGKKSGLGGVLKIVLASVYGKLCQSVGNPVHSNPIWASMITSMVRTQLRDAALSLGNGGADVIMLATDGLFCLEERPELVVGKKIGEWEHDVHDGIFVIQSGLYFLPGQKIKSRGIPKGNIQKRRDRIISEWDDYYGRIRHRLLPQREPMPRIPISQRRFISLTQAIAWGDITRAGQWPTDDRYLSFDFSSKREFSGVRNLFIDGAIRTIPHRGSTRAENAPYKQSIGGLSNNGTEEESSIKNEFDEGQPDWNFFTI